jgi:hypothetical protein
MASGHANRTNRPNTWPHRLNLRREESPCQLGAVHTWHYPELRRDAVSGRVLKVLRARNDCAGFVSPCPGADLPCEHRVTRCRALLPRSARTNKLA